MIYIYIYIYDEFEKEDKLLYTVWSLVIVRNQLPAQVVNLKIVIFPQFQVYLNKTKIGKADNKFIAS